MRRTFSCWALPGVLMLAGAASSFAGVIGTVSFTQPTGTVGQTDSISVYLTLALNPDSDPLTTDASGLVTSGMPADLTPFLFPSLPTGADGSGGITSNLNVAFGCSGTFTAVCTDGPPYDFTFSYTPPTFIAPQNLNLQPGDSVSYLFGTFTPSGGSAPPGTYTLPYAALFIQVYDTTFLADQNDPFSGPLHIGDIPLGSTVEGAAFTRDVLADAPEPGTWMMMLSGLGLAGGAALRRKRASSLIQGA